MRSCGQEAALRQIERIAGAELSALSVECLWEPSKEGGLLAVDIRLDCSQYAHIEGGLKYNKYEVFRLFIPSEFPYEIPTIQTLHKRFLGFAHVQWGKQLCLYLSPEMQWQPAAGMVGYIAQLHDWLAKAARNELDAEEGPLHPPIAYPGSNTVIEVVANTPGRGQWPWFGAAILEQRKENYFVLTDWRAVGDLSVDHGFAPALLLDFELPFEYPGSVADLLQWMAARGVATNKILILLMLAAKCLSEGEPLRFVIGAPSRGVVGDPDSRRQHLQVWEIENIYARNLSNVALACEILSGYGDDTPPEETQTIIDSVFDRLFKWQNEAQIMWCRIQENRPEIVIRRDKNTPMDWFQNKSVVVWGCGALGGQFAEQVVRAGASNVSLMDKAKVHAGILVRQNFVTDDINDSKAVALERRLKAIAPDITITSRPVNILTVLDAEDWQADADIIIDATASLRIRSKLESVLKGADRRVPIAAMMVSGQVQQGALVLSPTGYSGGTLDIFRRLGLAAKNRFWLSDAVDAFWGGRNKEPMRPPEPGCSDPTFVGSHTDISAMAARMLNQVARDLAEDTVDASAALLRADNTYARDFHTRLTPDILINDAGMQFRVAQNAWRDVRGWIRQGARIRQPQDETGGLLFGQIDEMLGVTWISTVSGPPEDSTFAAESFVCGTSGIESLAENYRTMSAGAVQYVGTWHSHPVSAARPSETDYAGIASIFAHNPNQGAYQSMMIVGYASQANTEIGLYSFEKQALEIQRGQTAIEMVANGGVVAAPELPKLPQSIGLTLSGGGSRAVAFHLGTLRALEDLELLDDIGVVSGVSGGAVMTGILGYTAEDFAAIDKRAASFLRQGLVKPGLRKLLHPKRWLALLCTTAAVTIPAMLLNIVIRIAILGITLFPGSANLNRGLSRIRWPLPRWFTRTHIIRDAIEDVLGSLPCDAPTRNDKAIIFNACELRTGTAFRMSNRQYGSWRIGSAPASALSVADAVTASASYPPFLPPFEWNKMLTKDKQTKSHRLIITDGGVYENLGISAMEPGGDPAIRIVNHTPGIIIASDASTGQMTGMDYPAGLTSRLSQSFNSVMRKVNDASKKRLHKMVETGEVDKFVYASLGQIDKQVVLKSPGWIARENVIDYPTNFSAMSEENIHGISGRGESITRALVTQYLLSD